MVFAVLAGEPALKGFYFFHSVALLAAKGELVSTEDITLVAFEAVDGTFKDTAHDLLHLVQLLILVQFLHDGLCESLVHIW